MHTALLSTTTVITVILPIPRLFTITRHCSMTFMFEITISQAPILNCSKKLHDYAAVWVHETVLYDKEKTNPVNVLSWSSTSLGKKVLVQERRRKERLYRKRAHC